MVCPSRMIRNHIDMRKPKKPQNLYFPWVGRESVACSSSFSQVFVLGATAGDSPESGIPDGISQLLSRGPRCVSACG